jgi:CDP-4-dehydro-6-deoxyglucose reductase/ferredoxin-NAD(P)+ reductase (naphthalene dioxygenase ferredoxin-specific)
LYFGVRGERDVGAEAELREWQAHIAQVKSCYRTGPGSSSASSARYGLVTDVVRADFAHFEGFQVYLAGPPAMVDAATNC